MSLTQELIGLIDATKDRMSDNDQRSALGIADTFVRGSTNTDTPMAKFDDEGPLNRDGLAASFMDAIGDADKEDARKALHEARMHLNAPFANDPKILKWREQRHARFPQGIGIAEK
jgi:hypothetical protein